MFKRILIIMLIVVMSLVLNVSVYSCAIESTQQSTEDTKQPRDGSVKRHPYAIYAHAWQPGEKPPNHHLCPAPTSGISNVLGPLANLAVQLYFEYLTTQEQ